MPPALDLVRRPAALLAEHPEDVDAAKRREELCLRVNQELFNDARLELADELISTDFVDHEAPDGFPTGPDAARSTVRWLHGAFDDMNYEVEDGKVAEHWANRDDAGMMRQLGFV